MGFWIYMLIMDLIIPVTMIFLGSYFMYRAPKNINHYFGYRTFMSMKNKDTWDFAHHYCGKIWLICGLILLPITIIVLVSVIGKSINTIGIVGGVFCFIQLIFFILSIIPTEIALRKYFDRNGEKYFGVIK